MHTTPGNLVVCGVLDAPPFGPSLQTRLDDLTTLTNLFCTFLKTETERPWTGPLLVSTTSASLHFLAGHLTSTTTVHGRFQTFSSTGFDHLNPFKILNFDLWTPWLPVSVMLSFSNTPHDSWLIKSRYSQGCPSHLSRALSSRDSPEFLLDCGGGPVLFNLSLQR